MVEGERRMSDATIFGAPADSAGFLLWRVSNAWQRALRGALQPLGITHAQFVVLATLSWIDGDASAKQHEIAGLAGMDPMTTSQVARSLERRDMVRREPHPEDGRAFRLALTQKGKRTVTRAVPAVQAAEQSFFGPVTRQHKALASALAVLASN
jgi:DNA-binding MarR family transcriptional regulator